MADAKQLVRTALEEIYENGDLDRADELIHPDYVSPEPAHPDHPGGPEGVKETVRGLHAMFADLRFEIHDEIAEDDRVAMRVTMHGRDIRSGAPFAMRQMHIWRVANGQLAEHWALRD